MCILQMFADAHALEESLNSLVGPHTPSTIENIQ